MSYRATNDPRIIQRLPDGAFIPREPTNLDYVQFLASGEKLDPAEVFPPNTKRNDAREAADKASKNPTPANIADAFDKLKAIL